MVEILRPQHLDLLQQVAELATQRNNAVYLVGGVIRDLLFGVPTKDVDFTVEASASSHAFHLAHAFQARFGGEVKTFERFFTAKVVGSPAFRELEAIDFASTRSEIYERPGALPRVELSDLSHDLQRRDFTINAMAIEPLELLAWVRTGADRERLLDSMIDPLGGRDDASALLVRVLHERSFIDDPTRIWRAIRYAVRIDGQIESQTSDLLRQAISSGALQTVSLQRIMTEWRRVLSEPRPFDCVVRLLEQGVLESSGLVHASWARECLELLKQLIADGINSDLALRALLLFRSKAERQEFARRLQIGQRTLAKLERELETRGKDSDQPSLAAVFQAARDRAVC